MIPVNINLMEKESGWQFLAVAAKDAQNEMWFYVARWGYGGWQWRKADDFYLSQR
jgi:hypothetical protein